MRVFEAILHELNKLLREKCAISQKNNWRKNKHLFSRIKFSIFTVKLANMKELSGNKHFGN